jgi:hypothetical protein
VDALLDWLVILLPALLSVAGVVVSMDAPKSHHRRRWYAGLIAFGVGMSGVAFLDQSRSRASHSAEIDQLMARLSQIEQNTLMPRFLRTSSFDGLRGASRSGGLLGMLKLRP